MAFSCLSAATSPSMAPRIAASSSCNRYFFPTCLQVLRTLSDEWPIKVKVHVVAALCDEGNSALGEGRPTRVPGGPRACTAASRLVGTPRAYRRRRAHVPGRAVFEYLAAEVLE